MLYFGFQSLTRLAKSVEDFYNHPQDIEWAIDSTGTVYLLQSRPITTINKHESLAFLPPGDGFWTFDPTHFPRPLSPWMQASYGFEYFTDRSRKAGCLIKNIKIRFVHGFAFTQPELFAPCEALERAAQAFWKKRLYEDEYREFTDFFRPECEMLQQELRVVNPAALGHSSLVEHVTKCFDYAVEFWKRHHTYSIPTMVIVGDFMNSMAALTGKDMMDTLVLLEGASPESRGILNQQDLLLGKLYSLLRRSEPAQALLRCDEKAASWALDCLLHMPNELGETMREVALTYGHTLAGGYDIVVPTLIESPHFFLKTLLQGVLEDEDKADIAEEQINTRIQEWRNTLPVEKHAEFDEILDLGRKFFRMRDERGLATDLSGVGLCRRGILEGGRRLADQGIISEAEHLTVATKREAIALLTGNLGMLRGEADPQGPVDIPTAQVLQRRFTYIKTADPSRIPRALGTPPPPPPEGGLPPGMARTMAAVDSGIFKGIWDEGSCTDEDVTKNPDLVKGAAASMGKVTGPVCRILQDDDLQKVKKGDIIITYSSSASFNIVLGLCSGIVTDYGGMLSHAAIVAREYGIPAIVGTQLATKKFQNGDMVCIDCSSSTVQRVEKA
jgi:rifampicin phosphotransferase